MVFRANAKVNHRLFLGGVPSDTEATRVPHFRFLSVGDVVPLAF